MEEIYDSLTDNQKNLFTALVIIADLKSRKNHISDIKFKKIIEKIGRNKDEIIKE